MNVTFWIKSNRGTDREAVVQMPDDARKADIRFELERWCSDFNAFTSSICRYGYRVEETRHD